MSDDELFPVPESFATGAHVDNDKYLEMYKRSVADPEAFWADQGKRIDWFTTDTKIKDVSYEADQAFQPFPDQSLPDRSFAELEELQSCAGQSFHPPIAWNGPGAHAVLRCTR